MATSSIFESVKINDPKTAERFIAALEAAEKDKIERDKLNFHPESCRELRDPDEIIAFFSGTSGHNMTSHPIFPARKIPEIQ